MFGGLKADLHMHTTCSDGDFRPEELVRLAAEAGLGIVSITDHDSVQGYSDARAAGETLGVEVIPGVELSVHVDEQEIHLLGYCFDVEDGRLRSHLETFRVQRHERAERMVEGLNRAGVPLDLDEVLASSQGESVGRPHVAAALVRRGYASSYQEAFERYLRPGGAAYVEKPRLAAEDALSLLHAAGGVGVLAHPGQWTPDAVLRDLIRAGLDGIEVVHPSHQPWLTAYYSDLAERYELLQTGGSDFHGARNADTHGLGRYSIPASRVAEMKRRAGRIRRSGPEA